MYERHAEKYTIMHIHANLLIKLGFNSKSVWVFQTPGGFFQICKSEEVFVQIISIFYS